MGYSERTIGETFTQPHLLTQTMLHPQNPDYTTTASRSLRFPFIVIEFKAVGSTRDNLWVAADQYADATSTCLNAVSKP